MNGFILIGVTTGSVDDFEMSSCNSSAVSSRARCNSSCDGNGALASSSSIISGFECVDGEMILFLLNMLLKPLLCRFPFPSMMLLGGVLPAELILQLLLTAVSLSS